MIDLDSISINCAASFTVNCTFNEEASQGSLMPSEMYPRKPLFLSALDGFLYAQPIPLLSIALIKKLLGVAINQNENPWRFGSKVENGLPVRGNQYREQIRFPLLKWSFSMLKCSKRTAKIKHYKAVGKSSLDGSKVNFFNGCPLR